MDSELEKNQEQKAADQTTGNSESYGRAAGNYQREYRSVTGRPQRPRIHTQRPYNAERQQASNDSQGGGFLPEGFGAGLQGASGNNGYQQRQQGGYQRGGYQQRQQGGYRPRYNQDGEQGGYQPRQQGGYRPRYNNNQDSEQGGYQPRQQGGYRPR